MAELQNTFSWSFSAASDFEECRRKRYWSKYAMWGGWDPKASAVQKKAYQLNKMDNRYSIMGQAVEQSVMWALKEHQAGRTVDADQVYEHAARPYLNRCWKESRDQLWKQSPKKNCCLHEHYYPDPDRDPKEWVLAIAEQSKQCIRNFLDRVLPRLVHVKPGQEVDIATPDKGGDPEHFEFEGIKVYAIPDYVYREDGKWHIHDWKAGRAKKEHRDQLAMYGLWANIKHGIAPGDMVVLIEYLYEGQVACEPVTEEMLESAKQQIRSSVTDMADYLVGEDIKRNEALPKEDWDLALTASPCRRCKFYELCEPELNFEG
jgi:hypothetical protein